MSRLCFTRHVPVFTYQWVCFHLCPWDFILSYPVFWLFVALQELDFMHSQFRQFSFLFSFFHLRNDNACFLELCVWEARIISLQMLQINITWHCKTSDFWQKHLFPFSLQPKTSSFQSRCLSPVLGLFLSPLIILPPQSPATYMVLYSLEALPGVGQPTSSPAQWTPSPLPPWVTWLAKRSVHLPHLLVHLGDPQPETEHIS